MKENIQAFIGAYFCLLILSLLSVMICYIWEESPFLVTEILAKVFMTILCFAIPIAIISGNIKDDEKV